MPQGRGGGTREEEEEEDDDEEKERDGERVRFQVLVEREDTHPPDTRRSYQDINDSNSSPLCCRSCVLL